MTVTDRLAAATAAPSIVAALAALPAAARRRTDPPLAWTSVPIDPIDPIALFSAARDVAGVDHDVSPLEDTLLAEVAVRFG